jgi:hypothetical protein
MQRPQGPGSRALTAIWEAYRVIDGTATNPDFEIHFDRKKGPYSPTRPCMTLDQKFWVGDGWMAGEERYKIAYWNWEVHGMESGPIQLTLRLSMFSPWVVAGNTLITFLRIAMARKGVSLVHASSVERNGQAWIFSGRSGAGKTLTALRALEIGWRLLGDDSCLVSEGGVKGYWQPLNLRGTYRSGIGMLSAVHST